VPSYRQLLRQPRLATFLTGDMVSQIGDGMIVVALPLETLRIRGRINPALAVALIEAAPYLLAVAVSLIFGLGRRRFRPRRLLITDSGLRCLVFSGLAALAFAHTLSLGVLAIALFLGSALRLLGASSRRLIATGMVDDNSRFAVNGLLGTSSSLAAYIVGPALGGLLVSITSPAVVLLVDGISFLALLIIGLTVVPNETTESTNDETTGWRILRRVPIAAWLLAVVFLFNLFYMPVEVALPLLVRGPLHASGTALGVIWTGFGIGALIGALSTNQLRRLPHIAVLIAIVAGWGGCVVLLAAAHSIAVAAIALAIGGLIYAPFTPVVYSLVQGALDPDQQQPVLTVWAAGSAVAAPIGLVLGGPLVQFTGIRGGLITSAALTFALVPAAARALRNSH
jgi:MFS family permease